MRGSIRSQKINATQFIVDRFLSCKDFVCMPGNYNLESKRIRSIGVVIRNIGLYMSMLVWPCYEGVVVVHKNKCNSVRCEPASFM